MPIEDADNENPRAGIDLSDIFRVRHSAHVFFFRRDIEDINALFFDVVLEKWLEVQSSLFSLLKNLLESVKEW